MKARATMGLCHDSWLDCPKGPRTQTIRFNAPNTIPIIVFGAKTLLFGSLDP